MFNGGRGGMQYTKKDTLARKYPHMQLICSTRDHLQDSKNLVRLSLLILHVNFNAESPRVRYSALQQTRLHGKSIVKRERMNIK